MDNNIWKGKVILVTGGFGFIGSNFIRYMLGKYDDVRIVNLDKLTYAGNPDNLKEFMSNPRYNFIQSDIATRKTVRPLLQLSDIVVHFAAETHVDRSIDNADSFMATNVLGTHCLLDEAVKSKHIERFIHISTDEVYGAKQRGFSTEDDTLKPSSPYAASKVGGDRLAYAYFYTYGLPCIILRPANNFGPYQYPEKLVPFFTISALQDKSLGLYGDGMQRRDWLYVGETCRAIDILGQKGTLGEAYNLGANNEQVNLVIAQKILEILGKPQSLITYVDDRLGHDRRYAVESYKAWKLGWHVETYFDDAFEDTVLWYKNNSQWWQRLVND